jgi:uncharacterized cupredoxin-like copper-binding protein
VEEQEQNAVDVLMVMRYSLPVLFLFAFSFGQAQEVMNIYPEDDCAEHVVYGAFLPANVNTSQDNQTRKNLDKYHLEFKVEKETYEPKEMVKVLLSNKGEKPVALAVEPDKKEDNKNKCRAKTDHYFVWTGEQGEISLVRISFFGKEKTLEPGQTIEFRIHLSKAGKYKFGLLTGNDEAFGDKGLIVTPVFEMTGK